MRATWLVVLGLAGCKASSAAPDGHIDFPGEEAGVIPYRGGGQFEVAVHADVDHLVGATHALVSLDLASCPGAGMPQAIAIYPSDGGLDGTTLLTCPRGGDVVVHASVAGVIIPDRTARLEAPGLSFHLLGISDNGSQWLYAYCVEATMADGMIAVHLDPATFTSGQADASLMLAPGACDPAAPSSGSGSHATYTVVSSGGKVRTTAVYAPELPNVFPDEVVVPAHVQPSIQLTSPSTVFAPLSIIELAVHVTVDGKPAAGMQVTLQAVPQVTANTVVPGVVVTNDAGDAIAHFQVPASGSIEIDASIGPTRSVKVFP